MPFKKKDLNLILHHTSWISELLDGYL